MNDVNSKTKKHTDIHAEARTRLGHVWNKEWPEREQCREDRRFATIPGASWEGAIGEQFENKPQFEVNLAGKSVKRIISDYRNNPITADFVSTDGEDSDELASVLDGLYRADEQDSDAEEAYDNAFDEAATGGFGAYRFTTKYEDEEDPDNENIRICIDPIFDADISVFFDDNSKKQSKSDAMWAFELTSYTTEAYEATFDDEPVSSWGKMSLRSYNYDWVTDDKVIVAEYFRVEKTPVKYVWYALASELNDEDLKEKEKRFKADDMSAKDIADLGDMGMVKTRERTVQERCVKKYTLSGNKVLAEEKILGKHIPIIPVFGMRWYIDGIERMAGHIRYAKDLSRLHNMEVSRLAEISASSPIAKPIFTAEQMAGHDDMWAEDAVKNYSYMLVNSMRDANGGLIPSGPIGYTKAPDIPPALAKLHEMTRQALDDVLGNQEGTEEIRSNVSKEVVEQIHARQDMQGYIYISNNAKSRARGGEVWLSMAVEAYAEKGRKLKTVDENGETSFVEVGRPVQREDQSVGYEADIGNAKFNVYTKVAPASSSRKAATVRTCTNMMAVVKEPEAQSVLSLVAMMNMEGEGTSGMQGFARKKLIGMGVVKPTKEEAQELAKAAEAEQGKPNPQEEYLKTEADKNRAQTLQAQANVKKYEADAEKAEAQTVAILAGIDAEERKLALESFRTLRDSGNNAAPPSAQ